MTSLPPELAHDPAELAARKKRNQALALGLVALMLIIMGVTMSKIAATGQVPTTYQAD